MIENAPGQVLFAIVALSVLCTLSCGIIWYVVMNEGRKKYKEIASLEAIANLEHQQARAMQQQLDNARDVTI